MRRTGEGVVRLRGMYISLSVVLVAAIALTIRFDDVDWVERFAPNLATEALSLIVTLAFVQRLLERRERAGKLRASVGALRKGAQALAAIAETWAMLVKGSFRHVPAELPLSIEACLSPFLTANLMHCDPRRLREAGDADPEPWVRWAARRLAAAQATLHQIINAYSVSLDPAYLEAIDELVDDPFIALVTELAGTDAMQAREWSVRINVARGYREAHFKRLIHAIELHNRLAGEAARFRSRPTAPKTNSIGIELPMDYDLLVRTRIDAAWWKEPPQPGALYAAGARVIAGESAEAGRLRAEPEIFSPDS
ncbi:MAG TPA: hypothetical protein VF192_10640 [Longimicrobiales bacterium]